MGIFLMDMEHSPAKMKRFVPKFLFVGETVARKAASGKQALSGVRMPKCRR
jgi:hypothetical protein